MYQEYNWGGPTFPIDSDNCGITGTCGSWYSSIIGWRNYAFQRMTSSRLRIVARRVCVRYTWCVRILALWFCRQSWQQPWARHNMVKIGTTCHDPNTTPRAWNDHQLCGRDRGSPYLSKHVRSSGAKWSAIHKLMSIDDVRLDYFSTAQYITLTIRQENPPKKTQNALVHRRWVSDIRNEEITGASARLKVVSGSSQVLLSGSASLYPRGSQRAIIAT